MLQVHLSSHAKYKYVLEALQHCMDKLCLFNKSPELESGIVPICFLIVKEVPLLHARSAQLLEMECFQYYSHH